MKRALLLLALALPGLAAHAASESAAPALAASASATAGPETALTVFNRKVFSFRGTLAGVSAADRAHRAQARIQELLERPGANQVGLAAEGMGILVQIDGATAFVVTPGDVAPDEDTTLETVAQRAGTALTAAVTESQESRNLDYMLHALGQALAATVVMWALVRLAAWLRRKVAGGFASLTQRHADRVQLGGLKPLQSERVVMLGRMLLTGVHRLFLFIVAYYWLS